MFQHPPLGKWLAGTRPSEKLPDEDEEAPVEGDSLTEHHHSRPRVFQEGRWRLEEGQRARQTRQSLPASVIRKIKSQIVSSEAILSVRLKK